MKWIQKYNGFLRSLRIFYFLYNLKNRNVLKRNKALYAKFGLKRSIFSNIQYKNFEHLESQYAENVVDEAYKKEFNTLDVSIKNECLNWEKDGFVLLKQFFPTNQIDAINAEVENLLVNNKADFNYTGKKIMQSYRLSPTVKEVFLDKKLTVVLNYLIGKNVIPFHTINFFKGSEQNAHSDSYHMSTYSEHNLIAAWVALEDVGIDQGPLFYYPSSHLWPQVKNKHLALEENCWRLDGNANDKFEAFTQQQIKQYQVKPNILLVKKGDVLIWHSNLVHGGMAMKNQDLTRKSLVMHYFTEEAICFHEISQRPVVFDRKILDELGF